MKKSNEELASRVTQLEERNILLLKKLKKYTERSDGHYDNVISNLKLEINYLQKQVEALETLISRVHEITSDEWITDNI